MRMFMPMALVLACTGWAQEPPSPADPGLEALIREAMERNPDLARTTDLIAAEKERIPQARALPDPILTLGLQNDGFQKLQIGTMENSYYQVMITQPFYGPGKRKAKGELASSDVEVVEAGVPRLARTLRAEVKRTYVGLMLVREQQRLLDAQQPLVQQAEVLARTRYEVGQGLQGDILRAQVALIRLSQTRLALEQEERVRLANLNRLRARPATMPVDTPSSLSAWPDPAPLAAEPLAETALQESPEMMQARAAQKQSERSLALARVNRRPDFSVSAGLMPRGRLDPMWSVSVGITLPVWSRQKQQRAVAEQTLRTRAQATETEGIGHLVMTRVHERSAQMETTLRMLKLYREGLLVQSEGAFRATLAQYETGKAPFSTVIESLNGWIADRSDFLQLQAQAQAIAIAQEELALGPVVAIGSAAVTAPSMGATAAGGSASPGRPASPSRSGGDAGTSSMNSM